jgi:hypothetical protein
VIVLLFIVCMVAIVLVKFASYDVTAWQVWMPALTVAAVMVDWIKYRWRHFLDSDQ